MGPGPWSVGAVSPRLVPGPGLIRTRNGGLERESQGEACVGGRGAWVFNGWVCILKVHSQVMPRNLLSRIRSTLGGADSPR